MDYPGYKKLFWAMIIISFHINIGYIKILPEAIGYMLIYFGLKNLSEQNENYEKGKIPAIILTILTLKDAWNNPNDNILTGGVYNIGLTNTVISSVVMIIKIYLIYIIISSMVEVYDKQGEDTFVDNIKAAWRFFLGVYLVYLFCMPFLMNLNEGFKIAIIFIMGIMQIVANLIIAFIFRKVKEFWSFKLKV